MMYIAFFTKATEDSDRSHGSSIHWFMTVQDQGVSSECYCLLLPTQVGTMEVRFAYMPHYNSPSSEQPSTASKVHFAL